MCPTCGFRMWMVPGGILWGFKLGHVTYLHACKYMAEGLWGKSPLQLQSNSFHISRFSCTQLNPNGGLWGWSPHHKGHLKYPILGAAPIHRALTRRKAANPFSPLTGWAWCSGGKCVEGLEVVSCVGRRWAHLDSPCFLNCTPPKLKSVDVNM